MAILCQRDIRVKRLCCAIAQPCTGMVGQAWKDTPSRHWLLILLEKIHHLVLRQV